MRCPFCRDADTRVLDSRDTDEGNATRRRRECASCGRRFTTYERIDGAMLSVRKKDGRMEPFEASKVRAGVAIACEKRAIAAGEIDALVLRIENAVRDEFVSEVASDEIGRRVMAELRRLDPVAFVRFASVYEEFQEAGSFVATVQSLEHVGEQPGDDDRSGGESGAASVEP